MRCAAVAPVPYCGAGRKRVISHKPYKRSRRVEEQLQRELAGLIARDVVDESFGLVTVTSVDVSPDLKHAKVYISSVGGSADRVQLLARLGRAAGFLRHELGRRVVLKNLPDLHFVYDTTEENAMALDSLIKHATDRSGGTPAS